jgi:hypothetical protein
MTVAREAAEHGTVAHDTSKYTNNNNDDDDDNNNNNNSP